MFFFFMNTYVLFYNNYELLFFNPKFLRWDLVTIGHGNSQMCIGLYIMFVIDDCHIHHHDIVCFSYDVIYPILCHFSSKSTISNVFGWSACWRGSSFTKWYRVMNVWFDMVWHHWGTWLHFMHSKGPINYVIGGYNDDGLLVAKSTSKII